jgi:hypothetical protein
MGRRLIQFEIEDLKRKISEQESFIAGSRFMPGKEQFDRVDRMKGKLFNLKERQSRGERWYYV